LGHFKDVYNKQMELNGKEKSLLTSADSLKIKMKEVKEKSKQYKELFEAKTKELDISLTKSNELEKKNAKAFNKIKENVATMKEDMFQNYLIVSYLIYLGFKERDDQI
jgi:hypothetical protein